MIRRRVVVILSALIATVVVLGSASAVSAVAPSDIRDTGQTTISGSAVEQALVVVLDLSTSMDESDGSGGVKLQSAKEAVEAAVRTQGEGSVVGIWGYPDEASCSPGAFVVDPEPMTSVTATTAEVDALVTRAGGTPIGAALQATETELRGRGFERATLLLVSDGLNNCEPDPCATAERLAGTEFDLTVEAIGFRPVDGQEDELSCIAEATGGSYHDAADGDELRDTLEELAKPALAVDVTFAPTVLSGGSAVIGITVRNSSSRDAMDVRTNLAFSRRDGASLMPAVVPPTLRLGNLPAGESVSAEWVVSTGRRGDAGSADFGVVT